jgi:hypothetical protein
MKSGLQQVYGRGQREISIFFSQFSQDRDAQAPEPVALAIFSRPGLEKSLENDGVAGVRQAIKLGLDGRGHYGFNVLWGSADIESHR